MTTTLTEAQRRKLPLITDRHTKPTLGVRHWQAPTVHKAGSSHAVRVVRAFIKQEERRRAKAAADRQAQVEYESRLLGKNRRRAAW